MSDLTVHSIGERILEEGDSIDCEWCGQEITDSVVTVVYTSIGFRDTCLDCRQDRPWCGP